MYIEVVLEAQQPNGEWWTRNTFTYDSAKVQTGNLTVEDVMELARKKMNQWIANSQETQPLRVRRSDQPLPKPKRKVKKCVEPSSLPPS